MKRKPLIDQYTKEELQEIVLKSNSIAEIIERLGYSTNSGRNSDTIKKRLEKYNIDTSHFMYKSPIKRTMENIFCKNSTASQQTLRRWINKRALLPHVCDVCEMEPIWQNKELPLILDHINGDKHDNRLENLRFVCPNCNQQLETTKARKRSTSPMRPKSTKYNRKTRYPKLNYCKACGKKISPYAAFCPECYCKSRRKVEIPAEELVKLLYSFNGNFTQAAKTLNVSANALVKMCKRYNLPYHSKDYRKAA